MVCSVMEFGDTTSTTDSFCSNIKGKPSHKIVSDGRLLTPP
jgi:hypothetical protein